LGDFGADYRFCPALAPFLGFLTPNAWIFHFPAPFSWISAPLAYRG
jgi:hypothetical protein